MIKVLFVTHTYDMGGANRSMLQLMKELKATKQVVPIVLAPIQENNKINIVTKCQELEIPCICTRFYWFKATSYIKPIIKMLLNYIILYPLALYKLRRYDFDIVHSNGSVIDLGGYISRVRNVRHVWHLREFGLLDFGLFSVFGKRYERFVYGMGDVFIAISKRVSQEYADVIPGNKIRLIYNGVIPKDNNLISRHTNDTIQIVMIGRIETAKNQMEAVQAVNGLIKQGCTNFHLNIIGSLVPSEYLTTVQDYVHKNELEKFVTFFGERDDVPLILSKMDVGLMLSKNEAFGRVTVEYMLQNIAVVASNTGANLELISDGETGLLYSLGDVALLANKLQMLIDNKSQMQKIATKGQKYALEHFISTQNTMAVLDVYNSLVVNSEASSPQAAW